MQNIPEVKLGIIAVSRDCFPIGLSVARREAIVKTCGGNIYECPVTVENEADMLKAVDDVKAAGVNALVVFLGNFGPETPETLIAKYFDGPCMFVAAAEGDGDLINGRGDAYCGMLNCSYNLGMRHLKGYIPEYPVGTAKDIGKMIKEFRHESHTPKGEKRAVWLASHMAGVTSAMRGFLKCIHALRLLFGKKLFGAMARGLRRLTGGALPLWNEYMPTGASHRAGIAPSSQKSCVGRDTTRDEMRKVVYFPSCITRTMGTTRAYSKEQEVTRVTAAVLEAAGYQIIYPEKMDSLCCGMLFSSKGYVEAGKQASDTLKAALTKASENGKYPILCDMTPCLYTMKSNFGDTLPLYEPTEFLDKFVMDHLTLKPVDEKVALFAVCSAKKMGVDPCLKRVAERCAREVVVVDSNCDGFAGDRGFLFPELNEHGLRDLKRQIEGCDEGVAVSRTCEVGLSRNSGIVFKSIVYLVARAAGLDIQK